MNVDFLPLLLSAMGKLSQAQASRSAEEQPSACVANERAASGKANPFPRGIAVTELSPDIAEGLYVDESGFLIHPHLLLPDEPRKSHEERWGTAPLPAPPRHGAETMRRRASFRE